MKSYKTSRRIKVLRNTMRIIKAESTICGILWHIVVIIIILVIFSHAMMSEVVLPKWEFYLFIECFSVVLKCC